MIKKKIAVLLLTATMVLTTGINAIAGGTDGWTEANQTAAGKNNGAWDKWVQSWDAAKKEPTKISLTPGKNASELNFDWYSKNTEASPKFKIGKQQDLSDAKEITVTTADAVTGYKSNKTTATGLQENTTYYYSYQVNGVWVAATPYKTQSTKNFSVLYVGDPQIGSSLSNNATGSTSAQGQDAAVRNDSFNWNNTINTALASHPNVSFMLSAGDQIQTSTPKSNEQDIEYAGYLSPDALKSLPVATTIGNHDSASPNYSYHFNNPNASTLGSTAAGGDYYYTYGNTLFIDLNTNNINMSEHQQIIQRAISENKDAKWRVVTIHQDIYGSGEHSNEPAVVSLRYSLIPILEANKIDVVLTGHDHTYSRSLILKGGSQDNSKMISGTEFSTDYGNELSGKDTPQAYKDYIGSIEDPKSVQTVTQDVTYKNGNVVDPSGILYMTANSASGSKYYDLVPHQQAYVAARWQQDIPTYSTIDFDDVSLTINTYRTDNGTKIDNTFSIIKAIDKSSLNQLIDSGNQKIGSKDSYTPSSYSKLDAALTAAKTLSSKAYANSQEIADAYTNLKNSIDGIETKGDKTKLKAAIDSTQTAFNNSMVGTSKGQYPSNAKDMLKAAITAAQATFDSADANQATVDAAVINLKTALDNFNSKVISTTAVNVVTTAGVKTGDDFNAYPIIAIAGISAAALIFVNRKKKYTEAK